MNQATANWKDAVRSIVTDWDGKHIVTSPDVDGILSALAVGKKTGATLAGIYTTRHYLGFDNSTLEDARNAIWLDHDISQLGIRCIGQHLVNHSVGDKLPRRHPVSFNPNIFYGQAYPDSFKGRDGKKRDKYPFATIHVLMSALGITEPPKYSDGYYLLAHADGSWGTCQDYAANTGIWYDLMFDSKDQVMTDLVCSDYCSDTHNLLNHTKLVDLLKQKGISSRTSREGPKTNIPEAWRGLQGHQGVRYTYRGTSDPAKIQKSNAVWLAKLNCITSLIADLTGWPAMMPAEITSFISGRVETPQPNAIKQGCFDQFMLDNSIFSHAITSNRELRYTTDLEI